MLAGMQRLGGARRYSRVKRAVENRKVGKGKLFAFKIFRDRVRGRLPFLRGNPKGAFCPCGEWRGDGLLSSRRELRFDRTVHIAYSDKRWIFLQKTADFQNAKPFANKKYLPKSQLRLQNLFSRYDT